MRSVCGGAMAACSGFVSEAAPRNACHKSEHEDGQSRDAPVSQSGDEMRRCGVVRAVGARNEKRTALGGWAVLLSCRQSEDCQEGTEQMLPRW